MTLDFAQSLYFREHERRTEQESSQTFRVAVLGLVGGVFSFYAAHYTPSGGFLPWLFLLCLAGALIFSALSITWIIRSYVGYRWSFIPNAVKLMSHYEALTSYHEQYGIDNATPDKVFESTF